MLSQPLVGASLRISPLQFDNLEEFLASATRHMLKDTLVVLAVTAICRSRGLSHCRILPACHADRTRPFLLQPDFAPPDVPDLHQPRGHAVGEQRDCDHGKGGFDVGKRRPGADRRF